MASEKWLSRPAKRATWIIDEKVTQLHHRPRGLPGGFVDDRRR